MYSCHINPALLLVTPCAETDFSQSKIKNSWNPMHLNIVGWKSHPLLISKN